MSIIAEYALGDNTLEHLMKKALTTKFRYSQDWTTNNAKYVWWTRLSWAWFLGRYVTGTTELHSLLTKLRGYSS